MEPSVVEAYRILAMLETTGCCEVENLEILELCRKANQLKAFSGEGLTF